MIPVFAILHYNRPDLLKRCVESIDVPVGRLVIIDGSETGHGIPAGVSPNSIISVPGGGVSSGINLTIKTFSAPWWFISSNDVEYRPGDLQKMAEAAEARHLERSAFYGNLAAAYQIITRLGVEKVGLYDENFYPMYLEDFDWMYRAKLADLIPENVEGTNTLHGEHGECAATARSSIEVSRQNEKNWPILSNYYFQKWGGHRIGASEKFTTPFNNPHLPIQYWQYDPALREQLR